MNKLYRSLLVTGIVAAGLAGCGDDVTITEPPPPPPPPPSQVRSVTVTPEVLNVSSTAAAQTFTFNAAVTADAGIGTLTYAWTTTDPTKATVAGTTATGTVTVVANAAGGTVGLRATVSAANGSTASGTATINIATSTVTAVVVTPGEANINVGQTIQLAANVQGTNSPSQAVTWQPLAPTIATVNATTGLVTGIAGGTAVIKACSVQAPAVCGNASITVLVPTPATVEIEQVTFTNTAGNEVPVLLTNVFGQIQVHLNVDNGDRQLDRVDALVGGIVVASQSFSQAAPPVAAAPSTAPRQVILSTNTMQVRKNGNIFLPVIFNGNNAITANLFVVGNPTPIASNAIPVVMNNTDAEVQPGTSGIGKFAPTPGVGTSVTVGGTTWYGNIATVDIETHFIAFQKTLPSAHTLTSVGCGAVVGGATITGTPTNGIVVSGVLPCTTAEGVVTPSAVPGATSYAPATSGPDGTGLVAPAFWSTVGSAFTVNGDSRWNLITPSLTTLAAINVDNVGPAVQIAGGAGTRAGLPFPIITTVPALVVFNDNFDQSWISNTYPFTVWNAATNPLGDLAAVDLGIGLDGPPTARRWDGTAVACGGSDLATQSGADFAETLTSAAPGTDFERACTWAVDLLGNQSSSGPSNTFGVDHASGFNGKAVFPTVRLAGSVATALPAIGPSTTSSVLTPANTTIYGSAGLGSPIGTTVAGESFFAFPATDVWGLEALDDRSGFDQFLAVAGFPASQSLARLAQTGATSCGLFTTALNQALSDTWVRTNPALVALDCALGIGYYTYTGRVTDRAGNPSATITRNFARDDVAAPTVTGFTATGLPYTPGNPGGFSFFALDDLEVISGTIAITIPLQTAPNPAATPVGTALRYPLGSVQGLGTKWDAVLTGIITTGVATIPYMYFRIDETCSGLGVPYVSCPAAPVVGFPYITAPKTPVSADYNTAPAVLTNAAHLPTGAQGDVSDVANQLSGAPAVTPFLPAFFQAPPAAPGLGIGEPWTAATNLLGWDLDLTTAPGVGLARQIGITSITTPFFEGAQLYRVNTAFEWVLCGDFPAPLPTDNGPHRIWTYTLAIPTAAGHPCVGATFAAGASYRALGRKTGSGLFTPTR